MVKSDRIGAIHSTRKEKSSNNDRNNRIQDLSTSDSNSTKIDYICPLCMEEMDETDKKFFPCKCRYQICLWCFYHVRDQLDNKCPACRQLYDDSLTNRSYNRENDNFDKEGFNWCGNAISKITETKIDEIKNFNNNNCINDGLDYNNDNNTLSNNNNNNNNNKNNDNSNNNHKSCSLEDMRIIQRNLVYVVGLSYSIAKREILSCDDSFGKYGKILNMRILPNDNDTCSAFITYYDELSATKAIKNINGKKLFGQNVIRCSFGTNKYCNSFIKNSTCNNPNCAYVHEIVDSNDCISKSELINFHSSNKFALKPLKELKSNSKSENENIKDRRVYRNKNKRNNYFKTEFNNHNHRNNHNINININSNIQNNNHSKNKQGSNNNKNKIDKNNDDNHISDNHNYDILNKNTLKNNDNLNNNHDLNNNNNNNINNSSSNNINDLTNDSNNDSNNDLNNDSSNNDHVGNEIINNNYYYNQNNDINDYNNININNVLNKNNSTNEDGLNNFNNDDVFINNINYQNNINHLNNYNYINIGSLNISNKEKATYDPIRNTKSNIQLDDHSILTNSNINNINEVLISDVHKNNILDLNTTSNHNISSNYYYTNNEENEYNNINNDVSLLEEDLELDIKNDIEKVIDEIPQIIDDHKNCEHSNSIEDQQQIYNQTLYNNNSLNQGYISNNIRALSSVEIGFIHSLQNRDIRQQINVNNSTLGSGINILRAIMPHANITIQGQ